ncbi:MAG TPA: hypothetical protein VFV86_10000 [Nitrososphaeraceae archaeon]|nr:hypothetical protein [Nitrososphaeraceae archaeon]
MELDSEICGVSNLQKEKRITAFIMMELLYRWVINISGYGLV